MSSERESGLALMNKHLMTSPKGNSEFCFPETLNVPRGEAERNIEVEGKQNSLFPEGPVIKCFVIPPDSNTEKKNCEKMICLTPTNCTKAVLTVRVDTSGSQTALCYRNDTIIAFFFAADKNKDSSLPSSTA